MQIQSHWWHHMDAYFKEISYWLQGKTLGRVDGSVGPALAVQVWKIWVWISRTQVGPIWLWEGIGDFLGASRPACLAYHSSQQDTCVKVEDDSQHLWVVLWPPHVYSHKYTGTHICTKILFFFFKKSKTGLLLWENYFK